MNPLPNRSLALQAYDGLDIPNHIDPDPTDEVVAYAESAFQRLLVASCTRLGPASGRYNCHGLVFAARRTNIPPSTLPHSIDIDRILNADVYEKIEPVPQVGDLIIYRSSDGFIDHSGLVSRVEKVGKQPIVFVWSMWGALGEFEHREEISPYQACNREYWRLKR